MEATIMAYVGTIGYNGYHIGELSLEGWGVVNKGGD